MMNNKIILLIITIIFKSLSGMHQTEETSQEPTEEFKKIAHFLQNYSSCAQRIEKEGEYKKELIVPAMHLQVPLHFIEKVCAHCTLCKDRFTQSNTIAVSNHLNPICLHIFHQECWKRKIKYSSTKTCALCNANLCSQSFTQVHVVKEAPSTFIFKNTSERTKSLLTYAATQSFETIKSLGFLVGATLIKSASLEFSANNEMDYFRCIIFLKLCIILCSIKRLSGEYLPSSCKFRAGGEALFYDFGLQVLVDMLLCLTPLGFLPPIFFYPYIFISDLRYLPDIQNAGGKVIHAIKELGKIGSLCLKEQD